MKNNKIFQDKIEDYEQKKRLFLQIFNYFINIFIDITKIFNNIHIIINNITIRIIAIKECLLNNL